MWKSVCVNCVLELKDRCSLFSISRQVLRDLKIPMLVTFRHIQCWRVGFVTMTAFSLHFYGRANTELSKTSGEVCSSEHIAENEVETPDLQLNRFLRWKLVEFTKSKRADYIVFRYVFGIIAHSLALNSAINYLFGTSKYSRTFYSLSSPRWAGRACNEIEL